MLTIKNVEISEESVDKILQWFTSTCTGIPTWLRNLLIIVIITGASYFLYTRLSISYDVEALQQEIATLNERCTTTVFYDRYIYDVTNLVNTTQNLEYEIDLLYETNDQIINLIMQFMKTHHTDDEEVLKEINKLKTRMDRAKDSYDKVLKYHISLYENWKPEQKFFDRELTTDSIKY